MELGPQVSEAPPLRPPRTKSPVLTWECGQEARLWGMSPAMAIGWTGGPGADPAGFLKAPLGQFMVWHICLL